MKQWIVFILSYLIYTNIWAAQIDLGVFYFTDAVSHTSENTYNRLAWDFFIGLNADKKARHVIGLNLNSVSTTDSIAGTETTFASSDLGIRYMFYMDKGLSWPIALTYNIQSTGTFNDGTEATWRGTSLLGSFGYIPEIEEGQHMGIYLNYYAGSYSERIVGTSTYTTVSYTKTMIYPSIVYSFRY